MSLTILHRDDDLLVVDKPSGLLVHRGWAKDRIVLTDLVREATGRGRVHPVGRLDRGASGVMLFALDKETARALEDAGPEKRYLVLVRGVPPEAGSIDHPLPRSEDGPRVPAVTDYRRLASEAVEPRSLSLVEAVPRTGRLHQVRRHLKHIDHPVLGDANYGKGALNRAIRSGYGLSRLALHARVVTFVHPVSAEKLYIHSPLPEDLAAPLRRMGFTLEGRDDETARDHPD